MLIAISSDQHIEAYQAFARSLPHGINSRLAELLAVQEQIAKIILDREITIHIRAGDWHDKKNRVEAVTFNETFARIKRASDRGLCQIFLKGNHDICSGGLRNSLEPFGHLPNTEVISEQGQSRTLPDGTRAHFLPYDDDPEVQKHAIQKLSTSTDHFNLLIGHCQIHGAKTGSEYVLPGLLTTGDLQLDRWDLVLCGHLHISQRLAKNAHYIGATSQRSFADEGLTPNFLILDTSTGVFERVLLPGPSFHTVEIYKPEDLEALQPILGGYYRVVLRAASLKGKAVDKALDGRCAGWVITYNLVGPAVTPRIDPSLTRWEDVMASYVTQAATDLDKARLLQVGNELRTASTDAPA